MCVCRVARFYKRARVNAATVGGGLARASATQLPAAANGGRSRDAPRPHACLQIIIIGPVAPPLQRGRLRATSYAQLSLHLAGFDSDHSLELPLRSVFGAFASPFYRSALGTQPCNRFGLKFLSVWNQMDRPLNNSVVDFSPINSQSFE